MMCGYETSPILWLCRGGKSFKMPSMHSVWFSSSLVLGLEGPEVSLLLHLSIWPSTVLCSNTSITLIKLHLDLGRCLSSFPFCQVADSPACPKPAGTESIFYAACQPRHLDLGRCSASEGGKLCPRSQFRNRWLSQCLGCQGNAVTVATVRKLAGSLGWGGYSRSRNTCGKRRRSPLNHPALLGCCARVAGSRCTCPNELHMIFVLLCVPWCLPY